MRALADWWDAVELWVTQLPFPLQVLLALVVVLPVCWVLATVLDRVAGLADVALPGRRSATPPPAPPAGTPPPAPAIDAAAPPAAPAAAGDPVAAQCGSSAPVAAEAVPATGDPRDGHR